MLATFVELCSLYLVRFPKRLQRRVICFLDLET